MEVLYKIEVCSTLLELYLMNIDCYAECLIILNLKMDSRYEEDRWREVGINVPNDRAGSQFLYHIANLLLPDEYFTTHKDRIVNQRSCKRLFDGAPIIIPICGGLHSKFHHSRSVDE